MLDQAAALAVESLNISLSANGIDVVEDITFALKPGEILGLVGESGSGKTTVGLALLGHCRSGLEASAGRIRLGDVDILRVDEAARRAMRGRTVAYVPQDPVMAMNPMLRIRTQLAEAITDKSDVDRRLRELLEEVNLPTDDEFLNRKPHQLSGGQLQRVSIAMAFANRPEIVILDEPTTGLDVTTQAHVLTTIRRLCREHRVAAVYVSHDLAVVAALADHVAVLYAGRLMEMGNATDVLTTPRHPYTQALLKAVPDLVKPRDLVGIKGQVPSLAERPPGCAFEPRCDFSTDICRTQPPAASFERGHVARCFHPAARRAADNGAVVSRVAEGRVLLALENISAFHGRRQILHDVSFSVREGSCVAIVGESGSGKTTLSRSIAGIHADWQGMMRFDGTPIGNSTSSRPQLLLRKIQYVFQNAYSSFNPRRTIGESMAAALSNFERLPSQALRKRVLSMLDTVMLPTSVADRGPGELSGGQRQRAAIARALIVDPVLMVCDEITSALDVSIQARIMELIASLQKERNMTIVFVTHNLALVRSVADELVVLEQGRVVEAGRTEFVFAKPVAPETQRLVRDTPRFEIA